MDEKFKEELNWLCATLQRHALTNRKKVEELRNEPDNYDNLFMRGSYSGAGSAYELCRTWLMRVMEENEETPDNCNFNGSCCDCTDPKCGGNENG